MIHFDHVTKKYPDGTVGMRNLDLKIEQGEFVSIIGRSGAGKSTMLRLINGMILPSEGKVHVLGHHIGHHESHRKLRLVRREIGFVFQQFNLINTHTVLSNVLMGRVGYMGCVRGVLGMFSEEDIEAAKKVIEEVGLKEQTHKRVDQISGGQQQRVGIARALLQQPKIILADEPMASLDPKLSEIVLDLLFKFNQERKITVLVNVHVLELAKRHATRIIGLRRGELVFDGGAAALTNDEVGRVYAD
jgi:phosphonate transport system ATP-binding protein